MPGGGADSIRERAGKLADETTQALERAKVEASEAADAHDNLKRVRRQLVEECDDRKCRLDKVRGEALTGAWRLWYGRRKNGGAAWRRSCLQEIGSGPACTGCECA